MLDVRQENVPNDGDNVDVQYSKSWRYKRKIDILSWWPNTPIELEQKKINEARRIVILPKSIERTK